MSGLRTAPFITTIWIIIVPIILIQKSAGFPEAVGKGAFYNYLAYYCANNIDTKSAGFPEAVGKGAFYHYLADSCANNLDTKSAGFLEQHKVSTSSH
jgi:hypothetical protein